MLVKMWKNRKFINCWWEFKMICVLWKTGLQFLVKLNILLYDTEIMLPGITKGINKEKL
jgi:hypothetical protein